MPPPPRPPREKTKEKENEASVGESIFALLILAGMAYGGYLFWQAMFGLDNKYTFTEESCEVISRVAEVAKHHHEYELPRSSAKIRMKAIMWEAEMPISEELFFDIIIEEAYQGTPRAKFSWESAEMSVRRYKELALEQCLLGLAEKE